MSKLDEIVKHYGSNTLSNNISNQKFNNKHKSANTIQQSELIALMLKAGYNASKISGPFVIFTKIVNEKVKIVPITWDRAVSEQTMNTLNKLYSVEFNKNIDLNSAFTTFQQFSANNKFFTKQHLEKTKELLNIKDKNKELNRQ